MRENILAWSKELRKISENIKNTWDFKCLTGHLRSDGVFSSALVVDQ